MRWDADSTADVKNIRSCCRFGIERGEDLPRRFASEELPPELRAVRVVVNEATEGERFMIPQNMRVPESSVIRSLFETEGERDAACREDLGDGRTRRTSGWRGVRWR